MPSSATESCFDVALWFVERARFEDSYLQAQKLQRMLWLAQGEYAAIYHGRKLIPATFVAKTLGPVEPNVFRAFELGRPEMPDVLPPPEVVDFLQRLWGRFGHHSTEHLSKLVCGHRVYVLALNMGEDTEIPFEDIAKFFVAERKVKPKTVIRSDDGREWKKWTPRSVK
jgi:uncharacterized phage-associated protein